MRYGAEHKEQTRKRVLKAAAKARNPRQRAAEGSLSPR